MRDNSVEPATFKIAERLMAIAQELLPAGAICGPNISPIQLGRA
ncbi:hypothetical protein [Bradyrhizobium sp. Rc3b]|nr:hypothetical protein [Bradyrhizobium sp. Rc3b]